MKARRGTRFDVEALRELVGDKVFARGQAYHRDGQVEILAVEPGRILARVAGTEDYRTELTGCGGDIGGECSCPALQDRGVCKHMVAAALAANSMDDVETEAGGALSRIREHLSQQGADSLVELILSLAERDPALFRRLSVAAETARADDGTALARLRKAIDEATRTGGYIDYREAASWAAGVEAVLDCVAQLPAAGRGAVALELAGRAVDRLEKAIGEIDDSDGHCGALLEQAQEIHLAAARVAQPEPVQFAGELFARETQSDYDVFNGAAELYADVLGSDGLAEYRRLAVLAWEQLPPRVGRTADGQRGPEGYRRLTKILDFFAERDGDVDSRVALRAKDLSSPWSYLQLAEFCLSQGRADEALRRAQDGLWMFEDDRPDERLVRFAVDLLSRAGRTEEAGAHLWRAFEKAPSLELYVQLRRLGGENVKARAAEFLEARLAGQPPAQWHGRADLLVGVLMHEQMFDQAWAAARKHGVSMGKKEALAMASQATHPREAIAAYSERVDQLVDAGGNAAYAEAAALLTRMAGLRSAAEQTTYVAALKARFARKRNFMKLLG